uniref:Transcription termination/antitermination protein NusA n=1 Tax=Desulfatirhabdium butyrativorans TaxID=340467 RepID=A0A7C4RUM3_9BACT
MYITEIKRIVDQVSRDKGIDRDILIQAIEEAIKSAARKRFGHRVELEISYNQQSGELEVYQYLEVVETVENPDTQISLKEGRKLDPECEIGDSLGIKLDTEQFGRIAAQSAKQVIVQKMKEAERSAVYANYIDHKGEIINGIVQRIEHGDIIVNLGQAEAILKTDQQIPKETYRRGDRIRAYIMDVLDPEKKEGIETTKRSFRGPQIILSRTHPNFLIHLFKTEVPEISEGVVQIKGAARDPGVRAKIAVTSTDSDIDPVGACVGVKGSRVQNVVQELRGEKIDIVLWHVDPARFVCNALAPAQITRVIIDEVNRSMEVIVPDEFLSIAIGKKGQNVKLAHKLTGWKLDVKSEKQYAEQMEKHLAQLAEIPDVGMEMAKMLHQKGLFTLEDLFHATEEDLIGMAGIDAERAARIIANVQELQASRQRRKSGKTSDTREEV